MVFVFGADLPVVEVYLVSSLITLALFIMIIFLFRNVWVLNKKLDLLLKEERIIKRELDETMDDEEQQLVIIKKIVKEMKALDRITRIGEKEVQLVRDILKDLKGMGSTRKVTKTYVKNLAKMVKKLDRVGTSYQQQIIKLEKIMGIAKK